MRNVLCCDFRFHPIGQGLFYTGKLKSERKDYNFVYDCGSDDKQTRMSAINNYIECLPKNVKLDLLVISHLHTDHYNGIKQLLKNRGAKLAILPYTPLWERIAIKFTTKKSTWSDVFISDPAAFLLENGVEEVIYIDNSDLNTEDTINIPEEFSPNLDGQDYKKMRFKSFESRDISSNSKTKLAESGGAIIAANGKWFFAFYNNPITKEIRLQFKQSLSAAGIDLTDADSVIEMMRRSKKNKVAAAYKKVFGEGDELNITSLITMHGPCGNPAFSINFCEHREVINLPISNRQFFQLLTGDFSFPLWLDHFYSKNRAILDKVAIASIPHHGSQHNWSNDVLEKIDAPLIWVASHAKINKHNHPSKLVKTSIVKKGRKFVDVTERHGINYGGIMFWR